MSISNDIYKIVEANKFVKGNRDFEKALENFENMEKRNLLKRRGYTLDAVKGVREIKYNSATDY